MKQAEKKVVLIKWLLEKQYREKVIRVVTGYNQSYINKVINNKMHKDIKADLNDCAAEIMTERQYKNYNIVNSILECKEIPSNDIEEDILYIHLLKFFLIEKKEIYKLYSHWTKSKINRYLLKKDIDILKFNSELLGIKKIDYIELLVDFFI